MTTSTTKAIGSSDFLGVLMAHLPSEGKYTTNTGIWARAILTLRERHEVECPEIFMDFRFIDKPPALPYCREVSVWLTNLYLCVGAPGAPSSHREDGIEYLKFPESFQRESRERLEQRLTQEALALIQGFAREIVEEGLLDPPYSE